MTGLKTPDPRVFQHALKLAGGLSPDITCHVVDELQADYFAPRQIGMKSFLLDQKGHWKSDDLKNVERSCVIRDLLELKDLIVLKT